MGPLLVGHVPDGHPVAREHLGRDEVKLFPFVGPQLERRVSSLLGREALEEPIRRGGHVRCGPFGGHHRTDDGHGRQTEGNDDAR